MKQQLGLEYSKSNPISLIVSNRLVQLVQHYGGMAVLGSILRCKKNPKMSRINHQIDIHTLNLMHTYGKTKTLEVYNLVYNSDNKLKIA